MQLREENNKKTKENNSMQLRKKTTRKQRENNSN